MRSGEDDNPGVAVPRAGEDVKLHLFIASLCLFLGTVVNLLVAWACALYPVLPYGIPVDSPHEHSEWLWPEPDWPSATRRELTGSLGTRRTEVTDQWEAIPAGPAMPTAYSRMHQMNRLDAGWPARSFRAEEWAPPVTAAPIKPVFVSLRRGIRGHRSGVWLPVRPLVVGLIINTAIYGGLIWAVFVGPFLVRQTRRRRRGLCPACAYPVGGRAVCSECGTPVTSGTVRSACEQPCGRATSLPPAGLRPEKR